MNDSEEFKPSLNK